MIEVSATIPVCEEIFFVISWEYNVVTALTLTARKTAQVDRKTPLGKNEMWLQLILMKEAAGLYPVIGPRMDDRVEVKRWVGGRTWVRIFDHEGTTREEGFEQVRALLLAFDDQGTWLRHSWSVGFHARKAVEQSTSDSHKMDKGPTLVPVVSGSSHSLRDRAPRRKHRMRPFADSEFYCMCIRIHSYGLTTALSSL